MEYLNIYAKNSKSMKVLILLSILFLLPFISAETETYQANQEINLQFTCTIGDAIPSASTTYNITVTYPDGDIFLDNVATTAKGNGAFNYTATFTETGLYKVQSFCVDGTDSFSSEDFYNITPTGKIQTSILENPLIIILGLLALVLVLIGATQGIPWFGFIGSILFILLGIYTMIYGFNDTTDMYTRGVAVTLIGMGFIFMFSAAYEWVWGGDFDE